MQFPQAQAQMAQQKLALDKHQSAAAPWRMADKTRWLPFWAH